MRYCVKYKTKKTTNGTKFFENYKDADKFALNVPGTALIIECDENEITIISRYNNE